MPDSAVVGEKPQLHSQAYKRLVSTGEGGFRQEWGELIYSFRLLFSSLTWTILQLKEHTTSTEFNGIQSKLAK